MPEQTANDWVNGVESQNAAAGNNEAPGGTPTPADSESPETYTPAQIEWDKDTDSVEGRVEGIIAQNSEPMQLNKTRALQDQQSRGTLNSSMAIQAGANALYDHAVPIATADARNSLDTKATNVGATNAALSLGEQGRQSIANINESGEVESGLMGERHGYTRDLNQQTHDLGVEMQSLLGDQALELTDLKGKWDNILQTNQSSAVIWSTAMTEMGGILSNADIPPDQKQQLINQILGQVDDWMTVTSSITDLDFGGLVDFDDTSGVDPSGNWQQFDWSKYTPGQGFPNPFAGGSTRGGAEYAPAKGLTNEEVINGIKGLPADAKEWFGKLFADRGIANGKFWSTADPDVIFKDVMAGGLTNQNKMYVISALHQAGVGKDQKPAE